MKARILLLVFGTFAGPHMIAQTQPSAPKADAIYIHANIYTGVTGGSSFHEVQRAQAMAVRADRILAVGTESDILKLKGPSTTTVDLQGHFVMPGFNDAHMHLTEAGFKKLTVDLTGTHSIEEFRDRIRKRVETAAPTEWIRGSGWDETLWQEKELPSRWDIDEVTSDHPVDATSAASRTGFCAKLRKRWFQRSFRHRAPINAARPSKLRWQRSPLRASLQFRTTPLTKMMRIFGFTNSLSAKAN